MRHILAVALLAAAPAFAQVQPTEPGKVREQLPNQQQAPSPQPPDANQQQTPAPQQPDSTQQQTPPAQQPTPSTQQPAPSEQPAAPTQQTPPAQQTAPVPDTTQQQSAPAQQQPVPSPQPEAVTPQQQPTPKPQPKIATTNLVQVFRGPTLSEVYCSGFFTRHSPKASGVVMSGYGAPDQVRFASGDYVYIKGSDMQEGQEYVLLRHMQDPNRYESFPGQLAMLNKMGEMYQDLGRVKVLYLRKKVAVAHIETSCSDSMPGDIAVPFQERPRPEFRQTNFDVFPASSDRTSGRVVMGYDLDTFIGAHRQVYLNIGEAQGVKPGDYFRVTREYSAATESYIDTLPLAEPPYDDTQKDPPNYDFKRQSGEFPRVAVGELMVLSTTENTSTALTTFARQDILLGDRVEAIDATPFPPPEQPETAAPEPPTISCSVSRSTINVGETSNITCNGVAEEGHTLAYTYQASAGQIAPNDNRATLTGTTPGPVTVTATATDDRNLTAQTTVNVDVQAPGAPTTPEQPGTTTPTPTLLNELTFKPNSTYVDNRAKAVLDDDALRLQRDATATLMIEGSANPNEKDTVALQRAENAKTYLVRSKGIDPGRIQTRAAQTKTGAKVSVIIVPAGTPQ